jgi:hypothetical protein
MGRPPLTEDQVRDKVLAYCARYEVSPGPEGLPPFPSGKRETRQHRDWMTVYRAHQRLKRRTAAAPPPGGTCAICRAPLQPERAVSLSTKAAGSAPPAWLDPACADLARRAEALGPEAVSRLNDLLWPRPRARA